MVDWKQLEAELNLEIDKTSSLSGGDISAVYKLSTSTGDYVLKLNDSSSQGLFKSEAHGMKLLKEADCLPVPRILKNGAVGGHVYILMEYIESGQKNAITFSQFGENLARLHQVTQSKFGLEVNNYIGALPQSNKQHEHWEDFYALERIQPQLKLAIEKGYLEASEIPSTDTIKSCAKSVFSKTKPALLHGDLWNGNYLITKDGEAALIDPAVYYGHPMMDIGMTKLFGGFENSFYTSYFKHSDINEKIDEQIDLAQLYYLLVHLNLFGLSYKSQVTRIIKTYF